jgi:hypothetical protein
MSGQSKQELVHIIIYYYIVHASPRNSSSLVHAKGSFGLPLPSVKTMLKSADLQ